MVRSPGGTPMKSRRSTETGTGLTPLMTKALRNKFKVRLVWKKWAHSKHSVVLLKITLKKVSVVRSPGGTHDKKSRRSTETGTGLTPLMTKALRNKFKVKLYVTGRV